MSLGRPPVRDSRRPPTPPLHTAPPRRRSLGVLMFELLVGKAPFDAPETEQTQLRIRAPRPSTRPRSALAAGSALPRCVLRGRLGRGGLPRGRHGLRRGARAAARAAAEEPGPPPQPARRARPPVDQAPHGRSRRLSVARALCRDCAATLLGLTTRARARVLARPIMLGGKLAPVAARSRAFGFLTARVVICLARC